MFNSKSWFLKFKCFVIITLDRKESRKDVCYVFILFTRIAFSNIMLLLDRREITRIGDLFIREGFSWFLKISSEDASEIRKRSF